MSYTLEKYGEAVGDDAALLKKGDAWREMMAHSHVCHARRGGYGDAILYIMKRYGVSELRDRAAGDGGIYEKVRLLPENAEEIERALLAICRAEGAVKVRKPKRGGYAELLLHSLAFCGWRIEHRRDYPPLPRERISPLKRLIFSPALRRLAGRLFKKGSSVRAFLKRFI